jgi:hypothetical protein
MRSASSPSYGLASTFRTARQKTILGNSWEPLKTKKSAREPRYYDLMAMEGGNEKRLTAKL